jgi:hypothetical protein
MEAATVTAITGLGADEVLEAFGADPAEPMVDREELSEMAPAVSLLEVPGGIVAIEDDGFEGSSGVVLHRASARGLAAAMYWNSGVGRFEFATGRDGVVSSAGESLYRGELGDDPHIAAAFAGLELASGDRIERLELLGLIAVERYTGLRIEGPPADPPVRVHRVLPHLPGHSGALPWSSRFKGDDDGLVMEAVLKSSPVQQSELAAVTARLMLERAGLADHPALVPTLDTIHRPEGPVLTPEGEILIRKALRKLEGGTYDKAARRALGVLYHAMNPHKDVAAVSALMDAQKALPAGERERFPAFVLGLSRRFGPGALGERISASPSAGSSSPASAGLQQPSAPDAESAVRAAYEGYRQALLDRDGRAAAALVSDSTIEYFQSLAAIAGTGGPEGIRARSLNDRLTIALLRVRRPPAELARMDGRELFAFGVEAGLFDSSSVADIRLGGVRVEGDRALAQLVIRGEASRLVYEFVRAGADWRLDVGPALLVANTVLKQLVRQASVPEDQFIFQMVESVSGQRVDASIFARP